MKSSLKLVTLFKLFEGWVVFKLVVVFEGGVAFELVFKLFELVVIFVFQSSTGLRFSGLEFF